MKEEIWKNYIVLLHFQRRTAIAAIMVMLLSLADCQLLSDKGEDICILRHAYKTKHSYSLFSVFLSTSVDKNFQYFQNVAT